MGVVDGVKGRATGVAAETGAPRRLHVYTKISLACAVVGFVINAAVGLMVRAASPWPLPSLLAENIGVTGILAMVSISLGTHAIVMHKWPGPTVIERARMPLARDVSLVAFAFFLTLLNLISAVTWVLRLERTLTG